MALVMHPDAALVEAQARSCSRAGDPKEQRAGGRRRTAERMRGVDRKCVRVPFGHGRLGYTFYVQIAGVPYDRDPRPETSAFSPAQRVL
jgi:hypothetical protein